LATIKTSGTGEKKKTLARPAKRFGKEVAAAVVFLGSDDASSITGVELAVDCGRTQLQPASCAVPRYIVRIIYANARRIYRMFTSCGRSPLAPSLPKGRSMMKRALIGIASLGILAVTVGVETANAQPYRRYGPARTYTPQTYPPPSRGSVSRGVQRTVPFSDPNSPEATGGGSLGYNRTVPHW
jgi:hypothetical protein